VKTVLLTWQGSRTGHMVGGDLEAYVAVFEVEQSGDDICQCSGEWEGATLPSQGPPCGTPSLVCWLKFYGGHQGRTHNLREWGENS
jgi:hypothetical protein